MAPIDVTILKVTDPSHFWAKEVPGHSSTGQARQFIRLCEEIDEYCSHDQFLNMHMYNPKKGMVCLVRKMGTDRWYRARVTSIILRTHLAEACCFLLDYGETVRIPMNRLRDIPKPFLDLPFQAREYCLYGLVPLTLKVSFEDDEAKMLPANKWDTAAVEYFDELLVDKPAKVDIQHVREDGIVLATLYVNVDQRRVNVNEELLRLKFAVRVDEPLVLDIAGARTPERTPSSKSCSPRSLSPGGGSKVDGGVTRQSPHNQQCQDATVSARVEVREGSVGSPKTTLKEYLGLSPQRHVERDEPALPGTIVSPVSPPGRKQNTPVQNMESSSPLGNNSYSEKPSGKPPCASQGTMSKRLRQSHLPTSERKMDSTETFPDQSEAEKAKGSSQKTTPSPVAREPKSSSSSHGQLLARLQAINEKVKNTSKECNPSPSDKDQARQIPRETPTQTPAQLTQEIRPQILPVRSSPVGPEKQFPTATPRLKLQSPMPTKPAGTTVAGATRLPFAVGGRFTLLPEELASIAPGGSVSPPKTLQSGRRKTKQGEFSSDPDFYNSSSDEPLQYVTPAVMPDRVIGQRLLKQISPACSTSLKSDTEKLLYSHIKKSSRVLVHGDRPPRPTLHIDQSPFPDSIHKKLSNLGFPGPSDIQAYSWPVILRGTDMVGVSAHGTGKSLAFLLPLITQSLQPSVYSSLPPGNGPLVIIVSPRWRKAADIYDQCCKFLPSQRGSKAILIHGGGSEEQQEVQLLNGCSILVATLPCLLRMLRDDHTSLNRLSHLVFDDADILCEEYTDNVKQLMIEYASILSSTHAHRIAPRQLLLFSSQWSVALGSFVRTYMANPVVVITSPLEAGVYARVWQVVRRVEPSQRDSLIRGLLEAGPGEAKRTVIFANSKDQAQQLQQVLLGGYSYYTLLAYKDMPQHYLNTVKKEWHTHHRKDSLPILVCTDDIVRDLDITNASMVVHYDFPPSKQKFGHRLSCMMDHYSSQLESNTVSDCQSVLLVSKGHALLIPGLVNLLKRCSFAIPTMLKMEEAIMEKEKESKNTKTLCHQLKAYGECRNELCIGRHQMFSDVDTPGCHANHIRIPSAGVVKILVTHIVDATTFYARILEYRNTEASDPVAMPTNHLDLAFELASWFSDPDHRVGCESPVAGDLCGIEDGRHVFHRVRVQRSKRAGSVLFEEEREVQFVDQGKVERVPVSMLLKLPDHLCSKPYQAVEIYVCRVKPLDGDTEWTTQAGFFVHDKIHDKQLEGKIILSLDNTLWLDPLVQRVHLPSIKTTVNIHNVRQELLDAGYAEDNPEHITNLREKCVGNVSLPDMVAPSFQESRSQPMLLPDPIYLTPSKDDFYPVYVSSVHTPGRLFLQLSSYTKRLEKLMEEINAKLSNKKAPSSPPKDWQPRVGEICLAKFHEDGRWNRVRILDIPADGKYEVFYLDYGDQEEVAMDWLHPAWNTILMLPFQAIPCSLINIGPPQDQWSDAAGDALWDMCLDGDNKKLLMAKVVSEGEKDAEPSPTDTSLYKIELFDTSSERDVVIGQQLLHAGYAVGNEAILQGMFPNVATDDTAEPSLSTEVGNMLSQLCLQLYQTKNVSEQEEVAAQINELITTLSQSECSSDVDVAPLCHLVASRRGHQQVTDTLAASLALSCFKNPKSCEVMCRNGGLKELCQLLLKTDDAQLQEYISYILMLSSGNPMSIREYGGIQALCQLLEKPPNANIVNQASAALAALVTDNNKNQCAVNEAGGLAAICKLLSSVKNEDCVVNLLRALSKMAANGGTRDEIRDEGGLLSLCDLFWETIDSRIVHIIAQTLTYMSCNNPQNVEIMWNQALMDCLDGQLMCMSHSESTQKLLVTLQIRLIEHSKTKADQSEHSYQPSSQSGPSHPTTSQSGVGVTTGQSGDAPVPGSQSGNRQQYKSKVISIQEVNNETQDLKHDDDDDLADMPPLEMVSEHALPKTQPKVLWSQRPNSVILGVQLRGVLTFDLDVTSTGVSFSAILDETNYAFTLELYGRVRAPEHAAVALGSEVLITLYKESIGTSWSRLTASKSKMAFVGVDFERWNEEDSDSEEDISYRFGIKKKTQPVRSKTISNRIPIAPVPELDTSESSESYSDDVDSSNDDAEFGYGQ